MVKSPPNLAIIIVSICISVPSDAHRCTHPLSETHSLSGQALAEHLLPTRYYAGNRELNKTKSLS